MKRSFFRSQDGAVTVESAIIMPFVVSLFCFLFLILQISFYSFALRTTVNQSVQQVATYAYPIYMVGQKISSIKQLEPVMIRLDSFQELKSFIPFLEEVTRVATTKMNAVVIRPFVISKIPTNTLQPKYVHVTSASFPTFRDANDHWIELEARYELPIRLPFLHTKIQIRKSAKERAWLGTSPPKITDQQQLHILSIQPNPVRRGTRAVITAQSMPNVNVSIQIRYKSGKSVARGLLPKLSDENGKLEWSWLVGGNTSPGTWEAIIQADGLQAIQEFKVIKK